MKSVIIAALLAASLTGCASASCDNAYDPDVCRDAPAMQSNFGAAMAAALAGGAAAMQQQPQYVPPPPARTLNCSSHVDAGGNVHLTCN